MATAWDERPAWGATEQREPLCSPELSSRKAKLVSSSGGGREGREPERHPAEQLWVLSVRAGHQNSSWIIPRQLHHRMGRGALSAPSWGSDSSGADQVKDFMVRQLSTVRMGLRLPAWLWQHIHNATQSEHFSAPSSIGDCLALLTFPLQPAEGQQRSSSRELGETPAGSRSSNPNLNPGRT